MDYEKKHEEIVRATQLWENGDITREQLEYIFPELKESGLEDEKIRKELYDFCIKCSHGDTLVNQQADFLRWATWLEKQKTSEKALQYLKENHSPSEVSDFQAAMNIAVVKAYDKGYNDALEKQGESSDKIHYWTEEEIEPIISDYLRGAEHYGGMIGRLRCLKPKSLEKQSGVDNVSLEASVNTVATDSKQTEPSHRKPRFNECDWVVDKESKEVFNISKKLANTYEIIDIEGNDYHVPHYTLEEEYDLWTIQDAKDGDILAFKNNIGGIVICKSSTDYDTGSYCRFVSDNLINKEESGWDSTLLVPATKEQRDLLFSKMKEEGYEWDAVKKELKKIKIITPLFNAGDTIIKKHNSDIRDFGPFTITAIIDNKYWYRDRIICDITEQDEWEFYEPVRQEPAWSEEDRTMAFTLMRDVGQMSYISKEGKNERIGWLNSLDEKFASIESAWSEDDEEKFRDVIRLVEQGAPVQSIRDHYANWLKSLKDRVKPQWKPSEEQMQVLIWCLPLFSDPKLKEVLKSLIDELKKL